MGNLAERFRAATTVIDPRPRTRLFQGARALVVVRPFLDEASKRWLGALRSRGCKLVGDFDDLLFAGDPNELPLVQSGAIGPREGAERLRRYRNGLACFDAFTVSTEPLREELRRVVGAERPVRVVPNGLSTRWVEQGRALYPSWQPGDPRRMRYLPGSPSHDADFAEIVPALVHLLTAHADLSLEIVGPLSLEESWFPEEWLAANRVRTHRRISFEELARLYASSWVTLAPLATTRFAQCKSAIKFLESAAFGAPCVATPSADMLSHQGGGALLADCSDRWVRHIEQLRDDERRFGLGERVRTYVDAHGTSRESASALHELLDELGVITARRAASLTVHRADSEADAAGSGDASVDRTQGVDVVADETATRRGQERDGASGGRPTVDEALLDGERTDESRAAGPSRPRGSGRCRMTSDHDRSDVLIVHLRDRHPAVRAAVHALRDAWLATGGRRLEITHGERPTSSAPSESAEAAVQPAGRTFPTSPPSVELRLGSLVRPAVLVSFAQPYGEADVRRATALALSTIAWDSLDDIEPWRALSSPLAGLPHLGTPEIHRPWSLTYGSDLARPHRRPPTRWHRSLSSRLGDDADKLGSSPSARGSPEPARDASDRLSSAQSHVIGGWPRWTDGLVWWPAHPRVVAALLGRAAEVVGRDDALCLDALRAAIPVRDAQSGMPVDESRVAALVPELAGLVPASLRGDPELWRLVVSEARAVARGGVQPVPLLTPAWIERGRTRREAHAQRPRSGIEQARRRYDKLLRDPRRFLADSRFSVLRTAATLWPPR